MKANDRALTGGLWPAICPLLLLLLGVSLDVGLGDPKGASLVLLVKDGPLVRSPEAGPARLRPKAGPLHWPLRLVP